MHTVPDARFDLCHGSRLLQTALRALSKADATVTINLRIDRFLKYGASHLDDLYFALKEGSVNRGEVDVAALLDARPHAIVVQQGGYRLFRIGDVVASRNIRAAILDAYRLMVAL